MVLNLARRARETITITWDDPLDLSPRNKELLLAMGRGWQIDQIAFEMGLTTGSVKVMMNKLKGKTGMSTLQLRILGDRMLEVLAS